MVVFRILLITKRFVWPSYDDALSFPEIAEKWDLLFVKRDEVMKALEIARNEKLVGKSLEAKLTIYTQDKATMCSIRTLVSGIYTSI